MFKRYAIYFTPQSGRFAQSGAAWLGWDLAKGCAVAQPHIDGIDVAAITDRPRKYGLHATIKAPFTLAAAVTEQDLTEALGDFCTSHQELSIEGLHLTQIGRFLALTPKGDVSQLNTLAAAVVRSLDRFRAPITTAEFDRKNRRNMSDRQRQLLRQWGYAGVEEFFQFHITLTGPIPDDVKDRVIDFLDGYLCPTIPASLKIDGLSLCAERTDGCFQQIARFALNKAPNSL